MATPKGPELFTIEDSHGKPRLTQPRPSDLGSVETGADRSRDHNADGTFSNGNSAARNRGARSALRGPYRAARRRIVEALANQAEPEVADVLLRDALLIFEAARAELGSRSVFTQGPTIAYAIESTLAGYYHQEAALAGHLTERGLELLDRAQSCETQAARAMTAALAAAKALGSKRTRSTKSVVQIIEERAAAALAARNEPPPKDPHHD
jgi:hypothetical protein